MGKVKEGMQVIRFGVLAMQVCVPKASTDEEVIEFANIHNPTGIGRGWSIRKEGSKYLSGDPERQQCEDAEDKVHITLDF